MEFNYLDLVSFDVVKDSSYTNRYSLFRDYLYQAWNVSTIDKKLRNTLKSLFVYWCNYINETDPKSYTYDGIKTLVRAYFGESVHEDMLNFTRFYYTTSYLIKKRVFDIVSPKYLVDNWNTKNKLFWYEDEIGKEDGVYITPLE